MSRSGKSIAIPTGMIIAALYVVLLVGFSRESYMRRDAAARGAAARGLAYEEVSEQTCQAGQPLCEALSDPAERQNCATSVATLRRLIGGQSSPLTMRDVRQALDGMQ